MFRWFAESHVASDFNGIAKGIVTHSFFFFLNGIVTHMMDIGKTQEANVLTLAKSIMKLHA